MLVVAGGVALSGCMGGGMDIAGMDSTDKNLVTNAIATNPATASDSTSDENTIRNAVSSADLSKNAGTPIPWANRSTGSAGVINSIREENNGSYVCRLFETTRHSYRGISKFSGRACLVGSGEWQIVEFREIG
ncbi:RT0821/Lpp0805 family surface protein [Rhizobium alvei]|uniref:RT0821/Lpp0805 family surface protein n=1 Tax=Rhizobium alvei TaxID=1132659 RepID=A0ABT8YGG1_9HYPH|nr:RT0821/Lpp0805 family surface protein [Rhizobium alvei]MDO6962765.1 RT0821/Lpp0805 family surface protein [Rhizobium alvei]